MPAGGQRARATTVAAAGLLAALAGCAGPTPDAPRGFAFRVAPAATFDLSIARELTPREQGDRLLGVRLLFTGEHHEDPRSHAAQLELLRLLQARGRLITVALEMFPPDADGALDDWRLGKVEEAEFLERARWYEHWGFPWPYYRELFLWFREQQIPLRGVNVDETTRGAVRRDQMQDLPAEVREELGDLSAVVEPHRDLLLAQLRGSGHEGKLDADAAQFKSFLRVQTLWERAMGRRAARIAETQPPSGIVVVLIGSGHLAYKLGANLQAAQVSSVAQLTLWDAMEPPELLDPQGRAHVPVGVADWARVYVQETAGPLYPSLAGVKLSQAAVGVRVDAVSPFAAPWLQGLQTGDVIRSVNRRLAGTPTRLRLACEALPWDLPAMFFVERQDTSVTLSLTPRQKGS
jgi:uncharacterized iron-regulated protein